MRSAICLLLALAVLQPVAARACSCSQPDEPLEELAQSTATFSGRVISIEIVDRYGQGWYQKRVTMTMADCWKGGLGSTVVVWTGMSDADCGEDFQIDTDWLVYAFGPADALHAGLCSRTQPLEWAAADLEQLGEPLCTVPVTPSTWSGMKRLYDLNATR